MRVVDHQTIYRNPHPAHRSIVASAVSLCVVRHGTGSRLLTAFRVAEAKMSPGGRIVMLASDDLGSTWNPVTSPLDVDPASVPSDEPGPDPVAIAARRALGRPTLTGAHLAAGDDGTVILAASRMWVADPESPGFVPAAAGIVDADALVVRGTADLRWDRPRSLDRRRHAHEWAIVCGVPLAVGPDRWILPLERHAHADVGADWLTRYHALLVASADGGRTWPEEAAMLNDPSGRRAHYDQRVARTGDGRLLSLAWVHDVIADVTEPARGGWSEDGGRTWGPTFDTGLLGGPLNPIRLRDGRLLVGYARRAAPASLRLALSDDDGRTWGREFIVWDEGRRRVVGDWAGPAAGTDRDVALWDTMWGWTFGTPTAVELGDRIGLTFFATGFDGISAVQFVRIALA